MRETSQPHGVTRWTPRSTYHSRRASQDAAGRRAAFASRIGSVLGSALVPGCGGRPQGEARDEGGADGEQTARPVRGTGCTRVRRRRGPYGSPAPAP